MLANHPARPMRMEDISVKDYYDRLAPQYDADRFGNSYGRYIDQQEQAFLRQLLKRLQPSATLDLGCGTGRLLNHATHGVDFSIEMLKIAQAKHPNKVLLEGRVDDIPLPDASMDAVLCFHVLMHQDEATTQAMLQEARRVLKPGGHLVVDFPSAQRRRSRQQAIGWHGANALNVADVQRIAGTSWRLKEHRGLMFLPVHRMPTSLRQTCLPLDDWLCQSRLKNWSSYLVVMLEAI